VTRHGVYVVSVAAILASLAVTHRLDAWVARHSARFAFGVDRVRDSSPSSTLSRGEWEASARDTALNLSHWTIVIAAVAIAVAIVVEVRRRRGGGPAPPGLPPVESIHAPTTSQNPFGSGS
jgi:hypothetical protein